MTTITRPAELLEIERPVTVAELCRAIGCSPQWVYKIIAAGAVRTGHVGRSHRIPIAEARRLAREAGAI